MRQRREKRPAMLDARRGLSRLTPTGIETIDARLALGGLPHFKIQIGSKTIVYCYVRKNACSAFKRVFVDLSDSREQREKAESEIRFMTRHHSVQSVREIAAADHVVFVYRDPIERIASLFLNKFVAQKGSKDIFAHYEKRTNHDPNAASFQDFAYRYLSSGVRSIDPPAMPQAAHLHRIVYTDVIFIDDLYHRMIPIVGNQIADLYFKSKVNSTVSEQTRIDENVAKVPASVLRNAYLTDRILPGKGDLLSDEIDQQLRRLYSEDVKLYECLRGQGGRLTRCRGTTTAE